MPANTHIAIVGAGFAGLKLARLLNKNPSYRITLFDKLNYHQFQPLLYQVATANLDASNISFPLRAIFSKSKNVLTKVAEVTELMPEQSMVQSTIGPVSYDHLVLACGADTNYFGNSNVSTHAFPMKSTLEALQLRNKLINNFEDAANSTDAEKRKRLLTIVIVGGGPTGIELSGALSEIRKEIIPKEYPELKNEEINIYLLEGSPRLLGNMSDHASEEAYKALRKLGVTIRLNTFVKDYDGEKILLVNDDVIFSELVIWAAGVKGVVIKGLPAEALTKDGRVKVDLYNRVAGTKNIFALGDLASMELPGFPRGLPQLANVAVDQAENLARNFIRAAKGKSLLEYQYVNKGTMATIGRNKAVVDMARPKLSFHGFTAWLIWMGLHLFLLIGFRNRLVVFIHWVYRYFRHNQSLSLLFDPLVREKQSAKGSRFQQRSNAA